MGSSTTKIIDTSCGNNNANDKINVDEALESLILDGSLKYSREYNNIKKLLEQGADPNAKSKKYNSTIFMQFMLVYPIFPDAIREHKKIFELLLQFGANLETCHPVSKLSIRDIIRIVSVYAKCNYLEKIK